MQQYRDAVLAPAGLRPIVGATITVTVLPGGGAATLYSGNGTGLLGSNVLTSNAQGEYQFYAANGRYQLSIAASGYSTTTRDVELWDPADTTAPARLAVALAETGAATRDQADLNSERHPVPADYVGTTRAAILQWAANKAAGGVLRLPAGSHAWTEGVTLAGQRLHVQGDGRQVSIVNFQPAGAAAAITLNEPAAGGMYQAGVRRLGFVGGANTQAKTAISLVNTANVEVSHIGIADGTWLGDSIGLHTAGRQSLRFTFSEIACARPVVFAVNATFPTLCTDHYLLDHLELIGTSDTRPVIEIQPDVMITTTTLRNIAAVGGQDGIQWLAGTPGGTSYMLVIDQCRFEGGRSTVAVGWALRLENTLQSLAVRDAYFGTDLVTPNRERNGAYIRNCQNALFENCWFVQGAGRTAIDMTFVAGSRLTLINCFLDSAATLTLTNARCVRYSSAAGRISAEWVHDAGSSAGAIRSDVYHGGTPFALANNASVALCDDSFTGYVYITSSADVGAQFFLRGGTRTVSERDDPDGFFTATLGTAGAYNVAWDPATSRYVLQNRVADATFQVYRVGTTA